ncbi:TonB-dependent receptor, partial [Helicobacter pylori]
MNDCFRIKSPSFLALGALTFLSFNSFVCAREQHHTLQKVTTTEQQFSS